MELVEKVKNLVNLPKKRMKKTELLDFFEQNRLLERQRVFYLGDSGGKRTIMSKLADDSEEPMIPSSLNKLGRLSAAQIRKLHREFVKDLSLKSKFDKMSASKLRSHIRRYKYNEIVNLDGTELDDEEEEKMETVEEKPQMEEEKEIPSDEKMMELIKKEMTAAVAKSETCECEE